MGKFQDISGMKFHKLTAINYLGNSSWNCLCECGNYHKVKTSELKNGHVKSCGCIKKKYKLNETFFDNVDTEEKAYILGLISSDGNVTVKPYNIKIDLKKDDEDVLYKIKNVMNYDFELKNYKQKSKIKGKEYITDIVRLNITNKKMVLKLLEYGIPPNKTEYLDFDFSCMDSKLIRHFLRGYFDGDGSVSIGVKNSISISITSNNKMIYKFVEILKNNINNYEPHIYIRNKDNDNCKTIILTKKNRKDIFFKISI